jgi:UDP-N-acetylglucosamine--N-acetylmuramyl-(pentapeptide) pyrophosphoryl-undecaprenol N-acetylglucosamine transferase
LTTVALVGTGGTMPLPNRWLASVLVPFPHAVDDHQTANAKFLSERGAAILIQQRDLSPEKLAALIGSLDRPRLLDMAKKARALGKPDAARIVAERCMRLAA